MFEDILNPLFVTEKGRYAGLAALCIASLLLLSSVTQTFSNWHSDYILAHEAVAPSAVKLSDGAAELIAQLPQAHLFGQEASGDADLLPITSLQLRLTGVMRMPQDMLSRAIVSQAGQSGKVYGIGDTLTAGIKVVAINDDNIVLERAGHLEKLPLARPPVLFKDKPKSLWSDHL